MIYKNGPYCLYVKSTDTKPTPESNPGIFNDNLVLIHELDTGKINYWDADNESWEEFSS